MAKAHDPGPIRARALHIRQPVSHDVILHLGFPGFGMKKWGNLGRIQDKGDSSNDRLICSSKSDHLVDMLA